MRVITGLARGRRLETPEGLETRPTSGKAKEAIFSAIQFEIEQANVLDLFAGSGQLGIEALSRGARFAVFVDSSADAYAAILRNLNSTGLMKSARAARMDALTFLKSTREKFDIIFLDPPYASGLAAEALPLCAAAASEGGVIICETDKDVYMPDCAGDFVCVKKYQYGRNTFHMYRRQD